MANEKTDATWETNDQIDFAKTNNKINDKPEEDAEMGDEQETNTDMNGGTEPEYECDTEQETDTDIIDGGPKPNSEGECDNGPKADADMIDGEPDPDGDSDGGYDARPGGDTEYVEDNMQVECICNNNVTPITKHTATQTQNQNINQPTEPNQRILCRPERQILKQKTLLAKNIDTRKKLEHSLDVKVLQIDRLQKHRTELKSELNLRWKEITTLRATIRNLERKLQESEAKLRETIKTNRWCTRTKHD